MSDIEVHPPLDFGSLSLSDAVLQALKDVGYESPSAIQAQTIPHVLAGRDILAQAQTGTGKTAAFALPLLSRIDLKNPNPQVLVLTPTRELAIQVSEAFQSYASYINGFHVLPVYGGQDYTSQLKQLKRGVHVVVGTPGRVMDHMRRGTLKLDSLRCLVLDEADEMLRMGFIDDVEWVLEQSPPARQIALFSATLPDVIRRIAKKHLKSPEEITIKVRTTTAESIHQRYWPVSGLHKLDALTRILEAETFDGILIFVRTKTQTTELAEKLAARGYSVAALNGDIPQKQRERTIERIKSGHVDIIVATDVAARGLDVDRISHVINFDIPHDTESYVHRIGRTGRFGRKGEAILFIAPRERHMLGEIERATRQKIELMELPSTEMINSKRIDQFTQRITDTLAKGQLEFFFQLIERYQQEHNVPALEIAAALAKLVQGDIPLLLKPPAKTERTESPAGKRHEARHDRGRRDEPGNRRDRDRKPSSHSRPVSASAADRKDHHKRPPRSDFDNTRTADRNDKLRKPSPRPDIVNVVPDGKEHHQRPSRPDFDTARIPDRNDKPRKPSPRPDILGAAPRRKDNHKRPPRPEFDTARIPERKDKFKKPVRPESRYAGPATVDTTQGSSAYPATPSRPKAGMERFRLDIGTRHGIKPGNIVGAITAEAGLATSNIDQIAIFDNYSTVDLPKGMPKDIFRDLKNVKISGQRLNISKIEQHGRDPQQKIERKKKLLTLEKNPRKQFKKKRPTG